MAQGIFMLLYFAMVIGILIFLVDALRRLVRAAEVTAAASTRQAQALEVLANRCETSNPRGNSSDAPPQ